MVEELNDLQRLIGHGCITFAKTHPKVVVSRMNPDTKEWVGASADTLPEAIEKLKCVISSDTSTE